MARTITPTDAHAIVNLMIKEAIGADSTIQAVDTSSFVSAGETLMSLGHENVLNVLSLVLGRTFVAVRPYKAKLQIINTLNSGLFTSRWRKISYYDDDMSAAGPWNTDLYTNLYEGFNAETTNPDGQGDPQSVGGMYEMHFKIPVEMWFGGASVWDYFYTVSSVALQTAFRNEEEFGKFISGLLTKAGNDIEKGKEAFNRMAILNKIAGVYDMSASMPGSVVNLTKAFNDKYGTSYTSEQLRTTYQKEFLSFFVETFKMTSKMLREDSTMFHWTPSATKTLSRHTSAADQRVLLYEPLFISAEANVLPEIFNPQYLDINTQYEGLLYWQNLNDPAAIKVTPAIPDVSDPTEQKKGNAVSIPYVVGMIMDRDALMVDYQFDGANTTPEHPRKRIRNTFYHFMRNICDDYTENTVIFIMEDPANDQNG